MRFQGYIINEGRSVKVDEADAIAGIRKDCKKILNAFKKGGGIYRGIYDEFEPFMKVKPSSFTRESANTSNVYTLVLDNHPKWKRYPKRSQSIICTSHQGNATGYGEAYFVFPKDGSTYGICPSSDFWVSFEKVGIEWMDGDFNNRLSWLYNTLYGVRKGLNPKSYNELVKQLKDIDKLIKERDVDIKEYIEWGKYRGDLLKMIQTALDPDKNDFVVTKDPMKIPPNNGDEVWTDGDSYLVHESWIAKNGIDSI